MLEMKKRDEMVEERMVLKIKLITLMWCYDQTENEELIKTFSIEMLSLKKQIDYLNMILG